MADGAFDRGAFAARLTTRRLGRELIALAETGSTNDRAWEAWAAGASHGCAVVADAQTRGRGRMGRPWHTAPGLGLALSLLLGSGRTAGSGRSALATGILPLAAGLALAEALERLGARTELKWPNDVLLGGRKVAGVLCESRGPGIAAVVVGVGVNVGQSRADFPPELIEEGPSRLAATSLRIAGHAGTREAVAAEFLSALEPLLERIESGREASVLEAWSARTAAWGRRVRVRTPGGAVEGIARRLDPSGALVVVEDAGTEIAITAGDVENAAAGVSEPR